MAKRTSWKIGSTWKDGKHYDFGYDTITVVQGWPGLRIWTKAENTPWRGTRIWDGDIKLRDPRELDLAIYKLEIQARMRTELHPFPLELCEFVEYMEMKAMLPLVKTIPLPALTRVLPFRRRRWSLLCLQARVPGADDLLDSNPVLGWILANHWVFRDGKGRSNASRVAQRLVGRRQRDILEWLGFESSDCARRIIGRIPPQHITAENLLYLRNALHWGIVKKAMQHQHTFTLDSLRMATDPVLLQRITPNFLSEVTRRSEASSKAHHAWKLAELLKLEKNYGFHLPARVRSIEELEALREDSRRFPLALSSTPYPPPPWPGALGIEPITNGRFLQQEGHEMHHCVVAYDRLITDGRLFVYKVNQPVRATLSVRRTTKGWKFQQIAGVCNKPIDRSIRNEVWARLTRKDPARAEHDDCSPLCL